MRSPGVCSGRGSDGHAGVMGTGCVTGRFQPVHRQHVELFEIALARCEHLLVAITNPDRRSRHEEGTSRHRHTAEANPFTYFERCLLLGAAVAERGIADRVTIVPFDLTRPEVWPDYVPLAARQYVRAYSDWERQKADWLVAAGYAVTVLGPAADTKVASSDIRRRLSDGRAWETDVPAATVRVLGRLLAERSMEQRMLDQGASPPRPPGPR